MSLDTISYRAIRSPSSIPLALSPEFFAHLQYSFPHASFSEESSSWLFGSPLRFAPLLFEAKLKYRDPFERFSLLWHWEQQVGHVAEVSFF